MTLYNRQLENFVSAVECGSFAKAAAQMYISTNAFIRHINILERDLGLKLLERTNQGITLTASGALIYEEAKRLIAASDKALERARELQGDATRRIRFGVSAMRSANKIVALWQAVRHDHPNIDIEMVSVPDDIGLWPKLYGALGDKIDVIVTGYPSSEWDWFERCAFKKIYRSKIICMVALDNPLADREYISLSDLEDKKVFVSRTGYAPEMDAIRDICESQHPSIILDDFEPYDFDSANKVLRDRAISLVPADWTDIHPGFKFIPMAEGFELTMVLLYGKGCKDAVVEFVEAVAEAAEQTEHLEAKEPVQ